MSSTASSSSSSSVHEYKTEIKDLLRIITHSLYSDRDIFLRELVSNASDALNKTKYFMSKKENLSVKLDDLKISITPDKEAKTLTISDTGIGMTAEELVQNLGTIAYSSTRQFLEQLQSKDVTLQGRFGLGFFSSFLIANKVDVYSRSMDSAEDSKWNVWTSSDTDTSFSVRECTEEDLQTLPSTYTCKSDAKHGSDIVLHLKEDAEEYLDVTKIQQIIRTHNQFLDNAVRVWSVRTETEEVPDDSEDTSITPIKEDGDEDGDDDEVKEDAVKEDGDEVEVKVKDDGEVEVKEDGDDDEVKEDGDEVEVKEDGDEVEVKKKIEGVVEDDEEDAEEKSKEEKPKKTKKVEKVIEEWQDVTLEKPIWHRDPSGISEEEYMKVYRAISGELHKYSALKHIKGEGNVEFKGLLFLPSRPQQDLYDSKKEKSTVKLYSKGVFITDRCKDLLPEWLEFVYGAVDSDDIPLNVSRELLQGNKALKTIGKSVVKKSIELLSDVMSDEEKSKEFYEKFSKSIKFGVNSDFTNRAKLMELIRYETSKTKEGERISLAKYVENMKSVQKDIYCICGESRKQMEASPYLDKLKEYDYEVLLMDDALDEYILQSNFEYKSHRFVNVCKTGLKIQNPDEDAEVKPEEEAEKLKKDEETYKPLVDKLNEVLKSKVNKVAVSRRFTSTPCMVCAPEYGQTANMERIMRAQALRGGMMYNEHNNRILEINPEHKVIKSLKEKVDAAEDIEKDAKTMYDIACLVAGYPLDDTNQFGMDLFEKLV
jgi:molecular chaperone HtpG